MASPQHMSQLSKFVTPILAHEITHQMQHSGSMDNMINPYVKDDEVEAALNESMFILDKMKTDKAFADMMMSSKDKSAYVEELLANARRAAAKDQTQFKSDITDHAYAHLPGLDTAKAQILAIVNAEIKRRYGLNCSCLIEIEKNAIKVDEVSRFTIDELNETVGEIQTSVLEKTRAEFLKDKTIYDAQIETAATIQSSDISDIRAGKKYVPQINEG
jgi:hypothetical protein